MEREEQKERMTFCSSSEDGAGGSSSVPPSSRLHLLGLTTLSATRWIRTLSTGSSDFTWVLHLTRKVLSSSDT
jgi:hypothetical protein